ncbi:MAG: CDP-diacylglycerol--glycerol-3-phosphate 3-phosphatidyltransferase [candidate division KSB1 bacterium]|nr:CDP-diacylglycerol--glycerol-3-phosphate 3-phosphatidyltransferase [candidate division KSB1 bacterium]MDZ7335614.1 CDP-diacylglycerol--glycerol-3-phosphate 3-phosphatidyltransferase [candidate division KSB1 bacterium]MDZ7357584.1 CDP-diacylglycerol--glycerol-3-phosphate 3-phosphatidyltransferase [candidate division KSB1 bacterium]MDZ7399758.1 CDP-diacylglycerol--glycerol-3-phosphate 3-phosphatidyltransferase [candidate division KSB1 bacterium]
MNLPTQLTLLRVILTPVFLLLFFHNSLTLKLLSFLVFIIASLTDWYDGYFAKKLGKVSQFGKFFDPLADKILVSSAFIAFYYQGYVKLWIVVVIVVRDFLITGLRSYALFTTRPVVTSGLARAKTFLQMVSVFVIYVVYLLDHYSIYNGQTFRILTAVQKLKIIDLLLWVVVFLTVYTGLRYLIENRAHLISIIKACYHAVIPSNYS